MSTATKPIQLRGNCQCCGRQHAVVRGFIVKHGYQVIGYFHGVCQGAGRKPLQQDREFADKLIADWGATASHNEKRSKDLQSGAVTPISYTRISTRQGVPDEVIPWENALPWQRSESLRAAIYNAESGARYYRNASQSLAELAGRMHGKPLVEAPKPDAPEPINVGERRTGARGMMTAKTIDRGIVWWTAESGLKGRSSTRSWRLLPLVATAPATTPERPS